MPRYVFDLECDGFLDEATRIHCLALKDIDTGDIYTFTPTEVVRGIRMLETAEQIIGHNVIKFDIPVIQKLYPWFVCYQAKVSDTLVLSRLIYADLGDVDQGNDFIKPDGKLTGSHSLKAWGQRLGLHKGDYNGGFDEFSQEMLDYNVQDVEVTDRLWKLIDGKGYDPRAIELEHDVAFIIAAQERRGIHFDVPKAEQLTATLQKRRLELEAQLEATFKPWYKPGDVVVPKVPNKERGTWGWYEDTGEKLKSGKPKLKFHGYPYSEIKLTIFNAGSRQHIADRLKTLYGWEPKQFTPSGQPKVDEKVLGTLPYPEAQLLATYFINQKLLGMLAEGDKAWLKSVTKEGKIHGTVITNGTQTGRGAHVDPNLGQVYKVKTDKEGNKILGEPGKYGAECRELFHVKPPRKQVGIDVSGLELRMLAHYLAKWDKGAYGEVVCHGDPHSVNQQAAGLSSRDQAKTFIYAFLYGGGDVKIGSIAAPKASENKQRTLGRSLKKSFTTKTPGLQKLVEGVQQASDRGYLVGLDGRHVPIRSSHSALNFLLQSAGAIICKKWMTLLDEQIRYRNLSAQQILWVHDELQFSVDPAEAEEFGELAIECIKRAGDYFGIRVPLTGEYKIGNNWKSCH